MVDDELTNVELLNDILKSQYRVLFALNGNDAVATARELIHGMPQDEWKATRQSPATDAQIAAMEASVKKNRVD